MVPEKKKISKKARLTSAVSCALLRKSYCAKPKGSCQDFFFLMGAGLGTGKHGPYGKDRA
jgi:hypothetical protein